MNQEIRFCVSPAGVQIAYSNSGEGPPLVKAANWLSHLEFDWQSPVWRPWLERLQQHHTLIRYDERGCGLSDRRITDFSFEAWVRDLELVVEALGLERFPLMGISQGGPIAIAYAVRHPKKVSHLILYGSYARGALKRNLSAQKLEELNLLTQLIKVGWGQENPAFRQVFSSIFIPDGTPKQYHWFNDLQRMSTSPENAAKIVTGFNSIDVRDIAPKVQCPTLVLHTTGDLRIPFEEGRLLAALIPDARFVPLESNNHILLETEPAWQNFFEEFYRFLGIAEPQTNTVEVTTPLSAIERTYWGLTDREQEVLKLMAQGYQNSEIAKTLVLSPKTIRNYVSNIFSKLQVTSRGKAIVLAREAGLIEENK